MAPEDRLEVLLPPDFGESTLQDLLDRVFSAEPEERERVSGRFDQRANPDLPDIYAVFLAVCEEWRDWRCALVVSSGGVAVDLGENCPGLMQAGAGPPVLSLHLEQRYSPLEYAVRHGLWESREQLLDWMRSLTVLYFLDKHEVRLSAAPSPGSTVLQRAMEDLRSREIVGLREGETEGEQDGDPEEGAGPEPAVLSITAEGRRFIAGLLAETESYIDQYDHYQDTLADMDRDIVEFSTGRGVDLRVAVYLAEELDPVRTVFLLRLYDGTLDARLSDWVEALESEEFYEGVLEPVVNRHSASAEAMELALDEGYAWLEERREMERREVADRDLLRRAGGGPS